MKLVTLICYWHCCYTQRRRLGLVDRVTYSRSRGLVESKLSLCFPFPPLLHHIASLLHQERSVWACSGGGCLCDKRNVTVSINPDISLLFNLKLLRDVHSCTWSFPSWLALLPLLGTGNWHVLVATQWCIEIFSSHHFFLFMYFIEVSLIYNVVLISAVQASDSVRHTSTFFFRFFSIIIYHRILNLVPCALQ